MEFTKEEVNLIHDNLIWEMKQTKDMIECPWWNCDLSQQEIEEAKQHLEKLKKLFNKIENNA